MYVVEFGKWNYHKWAEQSAEKVEEFWIYHEQIVRRQEKDAALNGGQGIVQIIDWDGFSLSNHASKNGNIASASNRAVVKVQFKVESSCCFTYFQLSSWP